MTIVSGQILSSVQSDAIHDAFEGFDQLVRVLALEDHDCRLLPPVDLAAVTDADDEDNEHVVVDLVENAVVPDPNPPDPLIRTAGEQDGTARSWIDLEPV